MPDGDISLGHIVISSAGRDADHAYVVLGWYKPQTLLVADGRGRKVVSPKKKNVKHVKRHSIANSLAEALLSGIKVTDEQVRQALAHCEATR
ncbi:MAG: KOW domain-containing RNA-binding protein [Sporomusa sp.]